MHKAAHPYGERPKKMQKLAFVQITAGPNFTHLLRVEKRGNVLIKHGVYRCCMHAYSDV